MARPQALVELGIALLVRLHLRQVPQVQPLACEVADEGVATAGRPPSAAPAASSTAGVAQPAAFRQVEELVVRDAAPEEERQPRGQLQIGDRGTSCRARCRRGSRSMRNRNAGWASRCRSARSIPGLEVRSPPAVAVAVPQAVQLGAARRPPVGAACQPRENPLRAGLLLLDRGRRAGEDPPTARSIARPAGQERTRDGEACQVRSRPRLVVEEPAGVGPHERFLQGEAQRLQRPGPRRLRQHVRLSEERGGQVVRAGRHRDPHAPVRVEVAAVSGQNRRRGWAAPRGPRRPARPRTGTARPARRRAGSPARASRRSAGCCPGCPGPAWPGSRTPRPAGSGAAPQAAARAQGKPLQVALLRKVPPGPCRRGSWAALRPARWRRG